MAGTAVGASIAVGTLSVLAPLVVVAAFVLGASVIGAWTRPTLAIALCLAAASLHRGLFIYLRVDPGGYPLSIFDVVPLLLLVAAVRLALKTRDSEPSSRRRLIAGGGMILAGLVIGVTLGVSGGATTYELLRVVRFEALILLVLVSVLLAGHTPEWRAAVLRGLLIVAICVAAQLLLTFCWGLATGNYFWSLFPFGRTDEQGLLSKVGAGNILTLRENAISGFLILPALSLALFRFTGRNITVLMFLVAGGLVWLSRGLWAAMLLTLLIILARRLTLGGLTGWRLAAIVVVVAGVVTVTFVASGGILGQQLGETAAAQGDLSFTLRLAETQANLDALRQGVLPLLFGLGTGVVAYPEGGSALLENSVLGAWTNTGLLGLCGVAFLFFAAGVRGWRLVSRADVVDIQALGAMSLALPVLWLLGLVGGTLGVEQSAVILFLLAGTAVVTPVQRPGADADRHKPVLSPDHGVS